jgi:hypothetical protein
VRNSTARAGDELYLTKPVGGGVASTAAKRGAASDSLMQRAVEVMAELNADAARAALAADASAMTDVTGFGLLGHLHELARASGLGAEVDAVAGEAGAGTLRYLLVAPAGRTRLLLTKYTTVLAFCLVATLVVAASALAVGAVLFPLGDLTTISGTRISFADGLGRALLIALVVAASLIGIAALGLFISTLTNSGIAAMATTVGLLITVQILDQIPQLHALQPYFFSHYWLSFADLMRDPVYWDDLTKNLGLQALYAAVFGSAAWARFTTRDITA